MKLIIGLGNPGQEYQHTKHNVGFKCIDKICKILNIDMNKNKFNGDYFQGIVNNEKVIFLKPQTYMNLSGECVVQFVNYFNIDMEDILVIYDDMDTAVGKIRIRAKGSSGGQNGIKNIISHLKTHDFARIRIGIGRNNLFSTRNYVLSVFTEEEQPKVTEAINNAASAAIDFLNEDVSKIMNKYNKRD